MTLHCSGAVLTAKGRTRVQDGSDNSDFSGLCILFKTMACHISGDTLRVL